MDRALNSSAHQLIKGDQDRSLTIQGTIWAHPICPEHDLGTERINQHLAKATQAALTKILPVEEDRFGK